jgi:hypothetical protein
MKIYPDDWRTRLITGVVSLACIAAALILQRVVGISGFLPLVLVLLVGMIVGNLLGPVVERRLFQPSSVDPPDHPPRG